MSIWKIVLLFFVVDEDRGGTCQSGKTENSGKPRTVKVECISSQSHHDDDWQECKEHAPPIYSSHLMLVVTKYLQLLLVLFVTVNLFTFWRLDEKFNDSWVYVLVGGQFLGSRQYVVIYRNSLLYLLTYGFAGGDACAFDWIWLFSYCLKLSC